MVRAIAEVAVNAPLERLFHYEVPESFVDRIEVGHRVLIPFGPRTTTGVCVSLPTSTDVEKLKPIRDLLHPECRFDQHLLDFTRWIADYYHAGWGEVLEAALPPALRSGRGEREIVWITPAKSAAKALAEAERWDKKAPARARLLRAIASSDTVPRPELLQQAKTNSGSLNWLLEQGWASAESRPYTFTAPEVDLEALASRVDGDLHPDQDKALETVESAITAEKFAAILIHGVTGSGKTEVYLRALRSVLERGRRGLVLVPEISLTPQTVFRFRQGLPDSDVAVLHSMLTDSERTRQWREIQSGNAKLVIGARSAVFAPIPDLGLIVVDEEHEPSYKQESSPRYNARDAAVVRASLLRVPILLGSATPCLESFHNTTNNRYQLVRMPRRVTAQELPIITTVALDSSFYHGDGSGLITNELDRLIHDRLRREEQIVLFLNRRGFATFVHCTRCGYVAQCSECDLTLTFHRRDKVLRCHYCGMRAPLPKECPDCHMPHLRRSGVGTEKITDTIASRYNTARVARLDRDTVTTHRAMQETLAQFARGEYDILVGTQMVAKGHDFPGVTLVGIVNADTSLHFPDFRAAERTFQLITQVAGRAGRGKRRGRVVVQTFYPDHYAVRCAQEGSDEEFYRLEQECREAMSYPPFGHIAKILLQGTDEKKVEAEAETVATQLRDATTQCQVLGPVAAPIARIQGRYRVHILVKSPSRNALHGVLDQLGEQKKARRKGVDRIIDVDPYSML